VAANTGLRSGELTSFTAESFDLDGDATGPIRVDQEVQPCAGSTFHLRLPLRRSGPLVPAQDHRQSSRQLDWPSPRPQVRGRIFPVAPDVLQDAPSLPGDELSDGVPDTSEIVIRQDSDNPGNKPGGPCKSRIV
jgi:hypothetical protein